MLPTQTSRACARVRERITLKILARVGASVPRSGQKKKPLAHGVCERRVGLFQPVFFFKRVKLIFGYRVIIYA